MDVARELFVDEIYTRITGQQAPSERDSTCLTCGATLLHRCGAPAGLSARDVVR
jgi:hypothetical protein